MRTVLDQNLDALMDEPAISWEKFKGQTVFVTGATGLIGQLLLKAFVKANQRFGLQMTLLGGARDFRKLQTLMGEHFSEIVYVHYEMSSPIELRPAVDYIFHCAAPTSSAYFVSHPSETAQAIVNSTQHMAEFTKRTRPKALIFLSSLEVYGYFDGGLKWVSETDFGSLDPALVRSSYSEAKRFSETLLTAYRVQYHLPITIARLTQLVGPGLNRLDKRVIVEFANAIIDHRDITLVTSGETVRTYCDTMDCLSALMIIALSKGDYAVYNVANESTLISIRAMAEQLIQAYPDSGTHLLIEPAENPQALGYNHEVKVGLKAERLESLGWQARYSLPASFQRMIACMQEETGGR